MQKEKAKSTTSRSWEELRQILPQDLTRDAGRSEFCRFVCNIETEAEEDTDVVKEGMVVFTSSYKQLIRRSKLTIVLQEGPLLGHVHGNFFCAHSD